MTLQKKKNKLHNIINVFSEVLGEGEERKYLPTIFSSILNNDLEGEKYIVEKV